MITRDGLAAELETCLNVSAFKDYCPNGLQVEGRETIQRIVTGVTASQALIERAIEARADALLVHHGLFWKGEASILTGIKKQRIARLMAHDINLFAYHLPLDCHPDLGNNRQLGELLGVMHSKTIAVDGIDDLIWLGELSDATTPTAWQKTLSNALAREAQHLPGSSQQIKRVAWCTGAAQRYIDVAHRHGADAYISGEVSEASFHLAQELGIHYYACGHHATERYGIQALGAYIAEKFTLEHQFIDIDNPI